MFTDPPNRAALPVRALKRVYDLPRDLPDHFAVLLARLAQRNDQPTEER